MPTFVFYRSKTKIDSQRGADQNALEEKVKKWYSEGADGDDSEECLVKGHVSKFLTIKILNIRTPKKFAVIILKLEQYCFTTEKLVQKMQMEWQTV